METERFIEICYIWEKDKEKGTNKYINMYIIQERALHTTTRIIMGHELWIIINSVRKYT